MKRLNWIDILRALAIIFVVVGHTITLDGVQNYIWSFQVPLFFFISGMLFSNKDKNFWEFLKKKIKTIMVPYYFFGIIFIIIFALLGKVAANSLNMTNLNFDFLTNLGGLLYGSAKTGNLKFNLPLWFLPCLFSVNSIYYFIDKIVKDNKYKLVIACIFMALVGYILNYHTNISCLPLGFETAITMSVFFGLGRLYKLNQFKGFDKPYWLVMIIIGWFISTKNGRVAYSEDIYNNIILFYLACLAAITGYTSLAKQIGKNKVLEFVGQNTLAILTIHKLPILFFQTVVPIVKTFLKANNIVVCLLVDAFTIACCLIASIIIKRIMPWALGQKNG